MKKYNYSALKMEKMGQMSFFSLACNSCTYPYKYSSYQGTLVIIPPTTQKFIILVG